MSPDPLTTPLTPSHVTLLLKHHKSTVLLSVLPSTPISDLKILLLAALTSRGIATLPPTTTSLPTDPEDIQFGVLVDKKDASKGFRPLLDNAPDDEDSKKKGKGKGRPSKTTATAGGGTVEAAGLTDGTWVAYRIRPGRSGRGDYDEDKDDEDLDVDMESDPGWDVVVPSIEDIDAAIAAEEEKDGGDGDDIPIPDVARVR